MVVMEMLVVVLGIDVHRAMVEIVTPSVMEVEMDQHVQHNLIVLTIA